MANDLSTANLLFSLARTKLAVFLATVFKTDTGAPAVPPRHSLEKFIPALTDDSLGHTLIIAPPGSAKTLTVMAAVAQWIGQDPTQHIGYITNTTFQARQRSVAVRDTVTSPVFRKMFPAVVANKSKGWSEDDWFVDRPDISDKDPTFTAAGVGSPVLGARFDRVILDDIADEENMLTRRSREKVIGWLNRTVMTRLTPHGRAIMICTRWAENDPAAWAEERGWHVVHIPALDENGQSYWPQHWPTADLLLRKSHMDARSFTLVYQGVVVDDTSAIFKRDWWKRWHILPDDTSLGGIFVDLAHTTSDNRDYSVILVARASKTGLYLLDLIRVRVEFPELEDLVIKARERWQLPVYIEDTPGAKPLIQRLRRVMAGILPWKIKGRDKQARARAIAPYCKAGNIFLPQWASWTGEFIEELAHFPLGAHDDQVDAFTMAGLQLLVGRMVLAPGEISYTHTEDDPNERNPGILKNIVRALPERFRDKMEVPDKWRPVR